MKNMSRTNSYTPQDIENDPLLFYDVYALFNIDKKHNTKIDNKHSISNKSIHHIQTCYDDSDYNSEDDVVISSTKYKKEYNFCCLCGIPKEKHINSHKYFEAFDDHRCKKCDKFYFEHKNCKCQWVPHTFLQ